MDVHEVLIECQMWKGCGNRTKVQGQGASPHSFVGSIGASSHKRWAVFLRSSLGRGCPSLCQPGPDTRDIAKDRFPFCMFAELKCQTLGVWEGQEPGEAVEEIPASGPGARQQVLKEEEAGEGCVYAQQTCLRFSRCPQDPRGTPRPSELPDVMRVCSAGPGRSHYGAWASVPSLGPEFATSVRTSWTNSRQRG